MIPVLAYADPTEAADWLCAAFGLEVRLRIANHRVQLVYGDGAVVAADGGGPDTAGYSMLVRVEDVDDHHARAVAAGARVLSPPTDYEFGERQYTVEDVGGHRWAFSQSVADVGPAEWGGVLVAPDRKGAT